MNLYQLFLIFLSTGIVVGLFPVLMSIFFQSNILMEYFYYFYGISTTLMGAGIGFLVGFIVYGKEKGAKDVE